MSILPKVCLLPSRIGAWPGSPESQNVNHYATDLHNSLFCYSDIDYQHSSTLILFKSVHDFITFSHK